MLKIPKVSESDDLFFYMQNIWADKELRTSRWMEHLDWTYMDKIKIIITLFGNIGEQKETCKSTFISKTFYLNWHQHDCFSLPGVWTE